MDPDETRDRQMSTIMKYSQLVIVLYLGIIDEQCVFANDPTHLFRKAHADLKALCPYTSFCGENTSLPFPYSDQEYPCCGSCSCESTCRKNGDCYFTDLNLNTSSKEEELTTVCRLSGVANPLNSDVYAMLYTYAEHYRMVSSCHSLNEYSQTDCEVSHTNDLEAFHPTYSPLTGQIYMNRNCSLCNNVTDAMPWQDVVMCLPEKEVFLSEFMNLILTSKDTYNHTECFVLYVPPDDQDLTPTRCKANIIRTCNESGRMPKWEPFWDLCQSFNATFTVQSAQYERNYGNVYCFLCNNEDIVKKDICRNEYISDFSKDVHNIPLTAVLEKSTVNRRQRDESKVDPGHQCPVNSVLIHSFAKVCRQLHCPSGQVRVNGHCSYLSKKWIGQFSVLLKLTPTASHSDISYQILEEMTERYRNSRQLKWIKRRAMKAWALLPLYQPSPNNISIQYLVVRATYPKQSVNHNELQQKVKETLLETWWLRYKNHNIALRVVLNECTNYLATVSATLSDYGIKANFAFSPVWVNYENLNIAEHELLFPLYHFNHLLFQKGTFITKLYLCDQIRLFPEEYEFRFVTIHFKVKNTVIHNFVMLKSTSELYSVYVCFDEFNLNGAVGSHDQLSHCMSSFCLLLVMMTIYSPR